METLIEPPASTVDDDSITLPSAVRAFAALGQETRLKIFRILLQEGPDGLPAGKIAQMLEVPPSTLSTHLGILEGAGLIRSQRDARQIFYAADITGTRGLLTYLTRDCCQGRPEICNDLGVSAALLRSEPNRNHHERSKNL